MTSLTKISIIARKIIRYSIFALIIFIIGRTTIRAGMTIYRHFYPEPPPPPTVKFNRLPVLPLPKNKAPDGVSYVMETPSGELPTFPSQAKVYFMPKLSPYFGSLDKAKDSAKKMGFVNIVEENEPVYVFRSDKYPSQLKINITTGVFSVSYNLSEDSSPISNRAVVPEIAVSKVTSFLTSGGLLPEDLTGPKSSEFIKVENQQLVPAVSLSEASLVKMNFFRKSFDDLPSVTKNPDQANVWFMVSGSTEKGKEVVAGEFHHFPVEESNNSTYPIKDAQTAWEELSQGKASIAKLGSNQNKKSITIRRIYLAYYDPPTSTDFYQPIVVFEGDSGFVAYLPAVISDYYGE